MSRKSKKTIEVQFDENGNPMEVIDERQIVKRKIDNQTRAMIEYSAMYASRVGNSEYAIGEWGDLPFSNIQVVLIAERLDVPCTVAEVRSVLSALVRDEFLTKPKGAKKYTYNPGWEAKYDALKAEIEALNGKRPTQAH